MSHFFKAKAYWQIRVAQDEWLPEIKGAVHLASLKWQNKINGAFQNLLKLGLLNSGVGGIIIENDFNFFERNAQPVIDFECAHGCTQ